MTVRSRSFRRRSLVYLETVSFTIPRSSFFFAAMRLFERCDFVGALFGLEAILWRSELLRPVAALFCRDFSRVFRNCELSTPSSPATFRSPSLEPVPDALRLKRVGFFVLAGVIPPPDFSRLIA